MNRFLFNAALLTFLSIGVAGNAQKKKEVSPMG